MAQFKPKLYDTFPSKGVRNLSDVTRQQHCHLWPTVNFNTLPETQQKGHE